MADYIQLELFDLKAHTSGQSTPEIYIAAQIKKPQGIESEQLELNLFPDKSVSSYFNLKQAA